MPALRVCVGLVTESAGDLEQKGSQLKDEEQTKKDLKKQLQQLHESNAELTAAKDAAETVCNVIDMFFYYS